MTQDPTAEAVTALYHAIASFEVSLTKLHDGQHATRVELRAMAPQLDKLVVRVEGLARDIGVLGERVHRTNNLVQIVLTDSQLLAETQTFLQRVVAALENRVDHLRGEVLKSTPPPPMPKGEIE